MGLFIVGDSKSNLDDSWPTLLINKLNSTSNVLWKEITPRFAIAGYAVSNILNYMIANLDSVQGTANVITINLGANDSFQTLLESAWKTRLTSIINLLINKWPDSKIYLDFIWVRDRETECNSINAWIIDVISKYTKNVFPGMDERTWLKDSPYTDDGIHYNLSGQLSCAEAKFSYVNQS